MPDPLEPIAISALQHWCYCPRQCGLIHLEQVFQENIFTQRGQALHKRVDDPGVEIREGLRVERALPLFCDRLGLVGKADIVEILPDGTPYPVEYKHGSRHKRTDIAYCDDIQLAAQALCLEEMTSRSVPEAALYYATSRRRREVAITPALRQSVESALAAIREMLTQGVLPPPCNDEHCRACSLSDLCQPQVLADNERQRQVYQSLFSGDD